MEKVRIISRDKNLIQTVTELLKNNYDVTYKKIPENFSYFQLNNPLLEEEDISDVGLIIADITKFHFSAEIANAVSGRQSIFSEEQLRSAGYDYELIRELKRVQIPKLLIINIEQVEFLNSNLIKYEDVILFKQLKEELLLRVRLIFNKFNTTDLKNLIIIGDMVINLEKYELSVKEGIIELTYKEFEMLKFLIQNENKVFSRNTLLSRIWGYDFYGGNRTVDVHMRRIRSKLPSPYDQMFKTVRNVGYMFSQKI